MAKPTEQELMMIQAKFDAGIKLSKEEKLVLKEFSKEEQEKKKGMSFGQRLLKAAKIEHATLMGKDEEDKFPIRDWISTGNYLFNSQISADPFKGMPSGRVAMFVGNSATGKCHHRDEEIELYVDEKIFKILNS